MDRYAAVQAVVAHIYGGLWPGYKVTSIVNPVYSGQELVLSITHTETNLAVHRALSERTLRTLSASGRYASGLANLLDSELKSMRAELAEQVQKHEEQFNPKREQRPDGTPVPDLIQPVLGYRSWTLRHGDDAGKLASVGVGDTTWQAGVMEARCLSDHEAPTKACSCGLYFYYDAEGLDEGEDNPWGVCLCWGKIEAHGTGFRAQYALPIAGLNIPELTLPYYKMEAFKSREELEDYARTRGIDFPAEQRPKGAGHGWSQAQTTTAVQRQILINKQLTRQRYNQLMAGYQYGPAPRYRPLPRYRPAPRFGPLSRHFGRPQVERWWFYPALGGFVTGLALIVGLALS